MKKYKLLVIVLLFSTLSCDEFLEENPESLLSPSIFPSTAAEAEAFLSGIADDDLNSGRYFDEAFWHLAQASTDETTSDETDGARFDIDHYTFLTTNVRIQDAYQSPFIVINEANTLIEAVEDEPWGARYEAGGRFYRAWMYFNLVRLFGDNIPLLVESSESLDPSFQPIRDTEVIYRQIEDDLLFAEENAPRTWTGSEDSPDDGRPTAGAAKAMLAKLYLTWAGWPVQDNSKWLLAAEKAQELIDMNLYDLQPNFSDVWTNWGTPLETSRENILSFHYSTTGNGDWRITRHFRPGELLPRNTRGTGRFLASEVTMDQFSDNDLRKAATFETQFVNNGDTITFRENWGGDNPLAGEPYCIKYDVDDQTYADAGRQSGANMNIFRYAEVLLILAEADNEANGGPTARAYDAVNRLRSRAGMPDLAGLSQENFRTAIQDEWTFELAYECKRRFNLVRWGLFDQVMSSDARSSDGYQPHMIYYPLPELEIGLTGWEQTDGY